MIAQMKGFDALNATQKTSALCEVPFLKKSRKTDSKWLKMGKMVKNGHFEPVFLDFFRNGTSQRAEVFCVAFSASKPFF